MSDSTSPSPGLWIVQGPDVASGKLTRALVDADIRQVEQIASDVVVLSMTVDRAERLRAEFPELVVEANSRLHQLG